MRQQSELYTRWAHEMRRKQLFHAGERVGVAVSGGPDSVLLLHFLRNFSAQMGLTLAVVHFNHHLRGAESNADERFVHQLADAHGLEFLHGEAAVAGVARANRRNVEATARELRYRFFFSLVSKGLVDKVATAHTTNDQAETVLLRLLRGTGARGLGGIYPVLEGKVFRPFLSLTHAEILNELEERKLECRTDSTNLETRLRRNKIRLELLPLLSREYNPEIVSLLKQLADRARDDEAYLEQQARERARPWRVREGSVEKIPVRPLADFPPAIARRVLRQMLQAVWGSLRGVSYAHIEALLRFAIDAQSGRSLVLPRGMLARKEFDWLSIRQEPGGQPETGFSCPVQVPGEVTVPQLGVVFRFKIVHPDRLAKGYNSLQMAGLDPRKLSGQLLLRNWRAGDRFQPLGSRKLQKLKELFRQQQIPRERRKLWPLLAAGQDVVWVRGFPPGEAVAAAGGAGEILIVEEEVAPSR
jgi:tRNA(Ile)-lysidine synthase